MAKKRPASRSRPLSRSTAEKSRLRIVGGDLRGRKIVYYGDRATRPMKDRTREAVFNILGPLAPTTTAVDLFAGTGALGFEALSRGASRAEFFETSQDALKTLGENARELGVENRVAIRQADAFRRAKRTGEVGEGPWLWFCCPPYAMVQDRTDDLVALIDDFVSRAPIGSRLVLEVEEKENLSWLPHADAWDWRRYSPAWIGILAVDAVERAPSEGEAGPESEDAGANDAGE